MEMIFHSHASKTNFHKKGCALALILNVRVFGTRKWPIRLSPLENGKGGLFVFQGKKPGNEVDRAGLLCFSYKNRDFGALSVTKRSCAAPISRVEPHISDRFCATLWCSKSNYHWS